MEYVLFATCILASSWQSFRIGIREGASRTVDKLITEEIIRLDNKGHIISNPRK
jgi:hypothetical protein